MKHETRNCQNCKKDFTIEVEDFNFYEKMKVLPPTFCPDCRFQRRLMFRNNRVFYRTKCVMCEKSILGLYNPNSPFTVYCKDCWLSDKWDPMSYGQEYDFSKSFFEQFRELQSKVPRANLYQTNFVSSEYCNYGLDFKECYLLFGGHNNERVYFGNQIFDSRDSLDISFSGGIELGYELFECWTSNNLFFSRNFVKNCVNGYYLTDCIDCINCFGCVGLRNKQYCIWNKQYSKEEYKKFMAEVNLGSYKSHLESLKKLEELDKSAIHRYAYVLRSVNSDGDYIYKSRNIHHAFNSGPAEDSKFLFFIKSNAKDAYDNSFVGFNSELTYELAHGFGGANCAFGTRNLDNQDSFYNEECHNCSNIFGCEGLRKKKYCILNKQYTKDEYEKLVPKIIEHMKDMPYVDKKGRVYKYGEFFPTELSPFAYNESIAQEYFPLTKEQAEKQDFIWKGVEERNYQITLQNDEIPDHIKDVTEDILNKIIACKHAGSCMEQCTEAFKIVPEELKFYKRMNLPLPRLCPNCRHFGRLKLRNPIKLWQRKCMCDKTSHFHGESKCEIDFKTTYSPDRLEIIYCEKCYQQEIY